MPWDPSPDTVPSHAITQSMADVQRVINRLANAAAPMPNNPLLGELAKGRGRSSAFRALRRLVHAGVLHVEVAGSSRRVQVRETGRWTAWGEARPGHVPYMHRRRGEPAPVQAEKPRAPHSRPLRATLGGPPPERLPPVSGYASHCQYANWADGERPPVRSGSPLVCGAPSESGTSYCLTHLLICYPKHRRHQARVPSAVTKARPGRFDEVLEDLRDGDGKTGDRVYSTEALEL